MSAVAEARTAEWEAVLVSAIARAYDIRAEDDAFIALSAELVKPVDFAQYATLHIADGLRKARFRPEGCKASTTFLLELRRNGLCDMRTPYLTAFGIAVRRVLVADDL